MVRNKSSLLIDEPPLMVLPSLAKAIGLNEAIFVQQLHWLLQHSGKKVKGQEGVWVYNTFQEWQERFTFWSESTIKRIVKELKKAGILRVGRFNRMQLDQTRWYSLDYEALNKKTPIGSSWHDGLGQVDTMTLGQSDPMLPKNKTTNQRDDAQTPPDAPTIPAELPAPAPRPPLEIHPFIEAHKEIIGMSLNRTQRAQLEDMPCDAKSVEQWRDTLKTWALNGWNPRSFMGMVDRYQKGNAPLPAPGTPTVKTQIRDGVEYEFVGGAWYRKHQVGANR